MPREESRMSSRMASYASALAIVSALVTFAATYVFATKEEVSAVKTEQVKLSGDVATEMTKIRGDVEIVKSKVDRIHDEQRDLRRSIDTLNRTITEKLVR